jgi:hypothetical protein
VASPTVSFTLTTQVFPVGVTVKAIAAKALGGQTPQPGQVPGGAPVAATAVATATGVVLTGLEPETRYWAAAEVAGVWRWVGFLTNPAGVAEGHLSWGAISSAGAILGSSGDFLSEMVTSGYYKITWNIARPTANYAVVATPATGEGGASRGIAIADVILAESCAIETRSTAAGLRAPLPFSFIALGP